jgi:hypothetical protein
LQIGFACVHKDISEWIYVYDFEGSFKPSTALKYDKNFDNVISLKTSVLTEEQFEERIIQMI